MAHGKIRETLYKKTEIRGNDEMKLQKLLLLAIIIFPILATGCTKSPEDKQKDAYENAQKSIESVQQAANVMTCIESAFEREGKIMIIVKNCGRAAINGPDLKVLVDEKPVSVNCDKDLSTGDTCEFELKETPFPKKGDRVTIKVTHPSGRDTEYVCAVTRDDQKVC